MAEMLAITVYIAGCGYTWDVVNMRHSDWPWGKRVWAAFSWPWRYGRLLAQRVLP